MREPARHEGAGARTANRHLLAEFEGDLAGEHVGHLVAVVVQVIGRVSTGRRGFLEHHTLSSVSPPKSLSAEDRPAAIAHTRP